MNYNFLFNESFHKPMLQELTESIWLVYDQGSGLSEKKMTITNTLSDPLLEEVPNLSVAPAVSYVTNTHDVIFLEGSENKLIINTEEPHVIYVLYNLSGQSRDTAQKSILYPALLKAGKNEIPIADKFLQDPVLSETNSKYLTIGLWNYSSSSPVIKDGLSINIESLDSASFTEGDMWIFDISENYLNTDLYLTYKYIPK